VLLPLGGLTTQSQAQAAAGAIAGTVTDPSGAVLKGAQVSIPTQDINVVSDQQGQFLIKGLASGNYTLTVSYVGFETFQKEAVAVAAGQTTNVAAALKVASSSQDVLVTAPRAGGEVEAINVERTADNIVQVLPAEVIRSLPNANMADALGRLPSVTLERDEGEGKYVQVRGTEPRLTNTTINGINVPSPEPGVRQIKFDAIPADIVESVQISKTLQANMEGDGIGGSVNLITKTATERPTISVSSMNGYTPIVNGRGLTEEAGTVGQRFGANKKFGALLGGSYDWNGRGIDDIEPVPDVATLSTGQTVSWKDAMDIREYRYFRSRWGLDGALDYSLGEGSNIYLKGLYSDFHNYGDRWVYSLTDNTPVFNPNIPSQYPNGMTLLGANGCGFDPNTGLESCSATASFNTQLRNPNISVGSLMLGGKHDLTTTWFTWDLSASRGFYGNAPYTTASFAPASGGGCQYDYLNTSNKFLPRWTAPCYAEAYNSSTLTLNDLNQSLGPSAQLNLQLAGTGAKRYHIGSHLATIEVGGNFRNVHKFSDGYTADNCPLNQQSSCPSAVTTSVALTTFPNRLTNTNYYGGNYNLGYNARVEDVFAYVKANPSQFVFSSTFGQDGQEYDLLEKVTAGYVMNTLDLSSRLRLVAGLRVEHTGDNVSNFEIGDTGISPNKFSGSYTTVLPSASLKYAVGPNSYLRFVYARGLSRPDEQDIAQALSWTVNGNGANRNQVSFGNANLKAETGDDIDVLFDHYLSPFGVISLGYFYKYLHNPIVTNNYILDNYLPPGAPAAAQGTYLASQPVNAGHAWVTGFEGAYLQHFSGLPGAWAGLGLSANYGYTASSTFGLFGRSGHPRLPRTSPNAFNISPTYDRGRVSLRVGMSYNQASIYGYQFTDCPGNPPGCSPTAGPVNGPLSDIYFYTHFQVDAQGSIRGPRGLTFVAYGQNLNNEVFGFYQGSQQYMIQREYYRPTIAAGVRWTPTREK
jgi:TonB-dependent receptor